MQRLIRGAERLGVELTAAQLDKFQCYYEELVDWNRRINLTAIVDYEEVQVKHFLDSLTVVLALGGRGGEGSVLDVGSGAGMPGVPLKILWPALRLTVLESAAKKTGFLRHLVERLGLEDVQVLTGRAEELAHQSEHRERFDIVVSRAVAALAGLVELTLPFCRLGGSFIAQKKAGISEEIAQAGRAIATLGGRLGKVIEVDIDDTLEMRALVVIEKVSITPPHYPRRPGVPTRRPLA